VSREPPQGAVRGNRRRRRTAPFGPRRCTLGPARRPELDGPYPAQPPGPRPDRSTRRCRRASHRPHPIRRETRRQKPRAVGSGRYQTGPPRLRSRRRYRRRDSQSRPVRLSLPESHECTYVIEPGISRLVLIGSVGERLFRPRRRGGVLDPQVAEQFVLLEADATAVGEKEQAEVRLDARPAGPCGLRGRVPRRGRRRSAPEARRRRRR